MNMELVELGDVVKVDRTTATDDACLKLPFVGLEHIEKDTGAFVSEYRPVPESLLATKFRFTPQHVLYSKLRPNLNKVVLPRFDGVCTTEILPLIPKNGAIDTTYLYFLLQSPRFVAWATHSVSGANLPRLDPKTFEEFCFYLPPKHDQQIFADGLLRARTIHRIHRHALQMCDELPPAAFLESFGDPVRNTKGWPSMELEELATVERGKFTPRPRNDPSYFGGTFPYIQTGDISDSGGRLRTWTQTLNEKGIKVSRCFPSGTIVIAIVGATIGKTAILDIEVYCPDSVVGIRVDPEQATTEYIEFLLRFWRPIFLAQAPETARANINLDTLRPLKIPLPPLQLQKEFTRLVDCLERLRATHIEALRQADHLFHTLLHRAFSHRQ